ncbi:non-classical arabinogalactan protein 30 [Arachis ipaensis]|uniref:non-classical arabinogalactan protein 30 n=1 Tax=Arachis ipaensis TaxID=130454 RepID=UPI000A2AFA16|nr:non-classical arabinogalactan protein 30 [Arachis ipaensis]
MKPPILSTYTASLLLFFTHFLCLLKKMALPVLLLLSSFLTVFAQDLHTIPPSSPSSPHHPPPAPVAHHHLPPTPTPTPLHPPHYTPTPAPAHPPVHSPAPVPHPPVSPVPRSFVAVQGVVYVKSCKYASVDTLLGALPLLDATVKLQCNNTRYKLVQTAKTDKNGYFFLEAPKSITTYGAHKCNVVLVSAPNGLKPSNLHGGITGALLRPQKPYVSDSKLPFFLYTVGPLAFQPNCPK